MKTRNGFVSNSSSSSFVVLLPENFLETIDYDKIVSEYDLEEGDEFPLEDLKRLMTDFVNSGGMYNDDIYEYDSGEWEFNDLLYTLIEPYEVMSIDAGPDEGQFVVLDREKIKELL